MSDELMVPRRAPRSSRSRRRRVGLLVPTLFAVLDPGHMAAQELPLRVEYPGSVPFACPVWSPPGPPSSETRHAVRELASDANESLVLGDFDRARALLARALELDGGDAELLYRYGRVLESVGERDEAIVQLCRALATRVPGDEDAGGALAPELLDARPRLDSLVAADRAELPPVAARAFDEGVARARRGQLADAVRAFETAAEAGHDWPAAIYNAGVLLGQLGRRSDAVRHLQRYLEMAPDAEDAVAVSHVIGRWAAESNDREVRPSATLALGLMVPGLGQFYAGRSRIGLGVLGLAGGAVTAGLLMREVSVTCLSEVPSGGACPSGQVVDQQVRRPYLGASLAMAGVVTVIGAVEAFVRSRRGGDQTPRGLVVGRLGGGAAAPARLGVGSVGTDLVLLALAVP